MPLNRSLLLVGFAAIVVVPVVRAGPLDAITTTAPFSLAPNNQAPSVDIPIVSRQPLVLEDRLVSPRNMKTLSDEDGKSADIDLSALRYFVSQGDAKRVGAEIRLIRSKHPDWQPPEDLLSDGGATIDESPFWEKFAKGDYAGVRADIEKRQAEQPEWRPSGDLAKKLATAEAYQSMVAASQDGRWSDVLRIGEDNKTLLTCDYVDALWRVAEALIHNDEEPRAAEAYRYVLMNCKAPQDRLATAQKAATLLKSPALVDEVLALGRRLPNGHDEFDSVQLDRLRKTIGAASLDLSAPRPQPELLSAFAKRARENALQDDQTLLGWYAYAQKDYTQAEDWFRQANAKSPFAKAAEGLVLTLQAEDKGDEALGLALKYMNLGAANRRLLVDAELDSKPSHVLTSDETTTLNSAIDELKDATAAQRFGWRLYDAGDVLKARPWFQKSIGWQPNEPAALGLIIADYRLKDLAGFNEATAKYREYPKVAEFAASVSRYVSVKHVKSKRKSASNAQKTNWMKHVAATRHYVNYAAPVVALAPRRSAHALKSAG